MRYTKQDLLLDIVIIITAVLVSPFVWIYRYIKLKDSK